MFWTWSQLNLGKIGPMVLEEFEKAWFQRQTKWWTGTLSEYGIIGISVLDIIQRIYQNQSNDNMHKL